MDPDLALYPDYDDSFASDEARADLESTSSQTLAAFAEFVRHGLGSDTVRQRSASHPVISHSCQGPRRLASSGPSQLPEVAESTRASPSTITPEIKETPSVLISEGAAARARSYSTTDSQLPRANPTTFREILSNVRAMSGIAQPDSNVARVTRRLTELANEFEREHFHQYTRWEVIFARVFGFPRPDVVEAFISFIKELQEEDLSWAFLIRFFFFGLKLLQGLSPTIDCLDEQQSELLDVFMNFLMDKLTAWVHSQGGWDYFPEVVSLSRSEPRPRSACTPAFIPGPPTIVPSPECNPLQPANGITPSSLNTNDSSALPSASSTLSTQHPTSMQNRVVTAAPSLPTPLNIPQNSASLPSHLSSASPGSASACSQSSFSTGTVIVTASLAVAFGFALGSFLNNWQ